jgi:hypothetical protein
MNVGSLHLFQKKCCSKAEIVLEPSEQNRCGLRSWNFLVANIKKFVMSSMGTNRWMISNYT